MMLTAQLKAQRLGCIVLAARALGYARLRVALCDQAVLAALLTKERRSSGGMKAAGTVPEAWLHDLAWAINGLSRRLPFRTDCLVRVLAAEQILRDRAPFEIHIGAGQTGGHFGAHAWLTCQGVEMTGGSVPGLERLYRSKAKS